MLLGAALGRRFERVTFESLKVTEWNQGAIEAARKLAEGNPMWLLLVGGVGRGKTSILAAIANEIHRKWPSVKVVYWPVAELVEALRDAMDGGPDPEPQCRSAHVLLLDDLGTENLTDWAAEAIQRIVDWRYRDMRPLVVATNLTLEELAQRYGARVARRLLDEAVVCRLDGPRWSAEKFADGHYSAEALPRRG